MDKTTPVFEVDYHCKNCNNRFKKRYKRGIKIVYHGEFSGQYVTENKINKFFDFGKKVSCPLCACTKIRLLSRTPLVPTVVQQREEEIYY